MRLSDIRQSRTHEYVTGGLDFRLDFNAVVETLSLPPTPRMVDLLRIAASAYFLDRLVSRDRKHGPDGWARKIECEIAVRDVEFWEKSTVRDVVRAGLEFVSGDKWSLSYVHDRTAPNLPKGGLFGVNDLFETHPVINLYSGGLDSAAGLARRISLGIGQPLIPVIVGHRSDIIHTATAQLRQLSTHFDVRLAPVPVGFSMTPPVQLVGSEELSQRTRSFLFVATGGVVAGTTGSSTLELYESGVGAINVPLLAGMEGSQATRSAHPNFLKLMSRLLSLVADRYRYRRRDTLCRVIEGRGREEPKQRRSARCGKINSLMCPLSGSAGKGVASWKSCGLCPACIFRRVALNAAGIEESRDVYQHDLLDPVSCRLNSKKRRYLLAYLLQVDSLAELDQGNIPSIIMCHMRACTEILRPGESQTTLRRAVAKI